MAIDDVKRYLAEFGLDGRVQEFDTYSATVELAAQAVGTEPSRIAKTLSFLVDGRAILIVASTVITASVISMCGQVGWVGLLVPH